MRLISRLISEPAHSETGIDIRPGAKIAPSFFIDHGTGVVIGETAVIGERVRLYRGVTLGARSFASDEEARLLEGAPRHPSSRTTGGGRARPRPPNSAPRRAPGRARDAPRHEENEP